MYIQPPKPRHELSALPDGTKAATRATLKRMSELVEYGKKTADVRQKATDLTKYLAGKNWSAEVETLWDFVKNKVRYVRDIRGVETLYSPDVTLQQMSGDCDDKAMLLAALLESIGHPTRFVAVGFSLGEYSHVFPETLIGAKWVPLETTEDVSIGWSPPGVVSRMIQNN